MKTTKLLILALISLFSSLNMLTAQEKKFLTHAEVGILAYNPSFKESALAFKLFFGPQLNPGIALGGSSGFELYPVNGDLTYNVVPVEVGIRYKLPVKSLSKLYLAANMGYGIAWLDKRMAGQSGSGGIRLNPELGIRFSTGKSGNFISLAAGYQYQNFKSKQFYEKYYRYFGNYDILINTTHIKDFTETQNINTHRFSLKLGFGF